VFQVGCAGAQVRPLPLHGHPAVQRRQCPGIEYLLAVLAEDFADALRLHLVEAPVAGIQVAEGIEQLPGVHRADPGRSGDVVRRVAHKRQQVHHLIGFHAHFFKHPLRTEHDVRLGVQDGDAIVHQLVHVLVRGDDADRESLGPAAVGQSGQNVVRFEAVLLQDRHAERRTQLVDKR